MLTHVLNGIDRTELLDRALRSKRIAIAASGSSVDRNLHHVVDILSDKYHVTKLFNMIFGLRGDFRYGERVPQYTDLKTGKEVYSIFNRNHVGPSPEMLSDIDAVVFDIREAGARYFEYLYCLGELMRSCAALGKEVIVLDRIAPLGGVKV